MSKEYPQRLLSVGAHADDREWAWAGLVSNYTALGHTADGVLMTDSNAEGIGKRRLEEERDAMRILGMSALYPIGYDRQFADGHLNLLDHFGPMVVALKKILEDAAEGGSPYTDVITFGIDGYSGHMDHTFVSQVVRYACCTLGAGNVQRLWTVGMSPAERAMWPQDYFVPVPQVAIANYTPIDITGSRPRKIEALQAHVSQLSNGGTDHIQRVQKLPAVEYFQITNRI